MYIVYQDLFFRYPEIEEWSYTETHVNSNLIYYGEMQLNSLLATHFSVPFSAAHPTIKDLAIDLSYLKALRTKDPDKAAKIEKAILGRIENIKAGKEYIFTGSGTLTPEASNMRVWSSTENYTPVHSMLDADVSEIDPDLLYDQEQARK
jgi:hypothetical protein